VLNFYHLVDIADPEEVSRISSRSVNVQAWVANLLQGLCGCGGWHSRHCEVHTGKVVYRDTSAWAFISLEGARECVAVHNLPGVRIIVLGV
jgi:hypothetical protein